MRPGSIMALISVVIVLFSLFVFLAVAGPAMGKMVSFAKDNKYVEKAGYGDEIDQIHRGVVFWTVIVVGAGIVLYGIVYSVKTESYHGRRRYR